MADYVVTMQKLAEQISTSEEEGVEATAIPTDILKSLVMRGLRPHIKKHVVQQNPKTLNDVVSAAKAAELSETVTITGTESKLDALVAGVQNLGARLAAKPTLSTVDRRSPTRILVENAQG